MSACLQLGKPCSWSSTNINAPSSHSGLTSLCLFVLRIAWPYAAKALQATPSTLMVSELLISKLQSSCLIVQCLHITTEVAVHSLRSIKGDITRRCTRKRSAPDCQILKAVLQSNC